MRVFRGIAVSPGVVIAPAFVLRDLDAMPPRRGIENTEIEAEVQRFKDALDRSREDLSEMASHSGLSEAVGSIAAGHREFLRDPTLLRHVEDAIRNGRSSADYAVAVVFRRWIEKFKAMEDEFFRQRYVDLVDLERRVLRHLLTDAPEERPTPDHPAVLIARDLTPSQAADLDRKAFVGFATELGGATSHTAIVAKSLGIPAVCALGSIADAVRSGMTVICDGRAGELIIEPDPATLERYRARRTRQERRFRVLKRMAELPAETPDGWPVGVFANIEFPFEIEQAVANGADGIGLYRTEFLYADNHALPDEEAHLHAYRVALEKLKGRSMVVRTFDFGADKFAADLGMEGEANPALGCRSIRYSFFRPELFRTQLRAILRASWEGRISLMFPMISSVSEMRRARAVLEDVKADLRRDHHEFDPNIKVGAMVEVPSAAVAADLLAQECDFFSLGTNDLTQYTLAVDRTNDRVAPLFRPSNPAVLRLLKTVSQAGQARNRAVAMCGEMASERRYAILLLGMGIRRFSVAPATVPEVKRVVRSVSRHEAARITGHALTLATPEEVDAYLAECADSLLGEA
ncbi:MAG: phosphoenolpyruvate--protein phosphotransferase [Planctomycetota bacterium]|jgi:phosphotransferase system enzyme I (PtsI)